MCCGVSRCVLRGAKAWFREATVAQRRQVESVTWVKGFSSSRRPEGGRVSPSGLSAPTSSTSSGQRARLRGFGHFRLNQAVCANFVQDSACRRSKRLINAKQTGNRLAANRFALLLPINLPLSIVTYRNIFRFLPLVQTNKFRTFRFTLRKQDVRETVSSTGKMQAHPVRYLHWAISYSFMEERLKPH